VILYVNGDSNSSGNELKDSGKSSWPQLLANRLDISLANEAKSGTSNPQIIRTASNSLSRANKDTFVIIGWTSWEREEWLHQGQYYNVNSGGYDTLPPELEERYKQWVIEQGPEQQSIKSKLMHSQIHRMHRSLLERHIPHLFFNALMPFQHNLLDPIQLNWHKNYVGPYDNDLSYFWYLKNHGWKPTKNNHFLENAQAEWSDVLYNYIRDNELI
jgi:hypothetical protein